MIKIGLEVCVLMDIFGHFILMDISGHFFPINVAGHFYFFGRHWTFIPKDIMDIFVTIKHGPILLWTLSPF